MVKIRIMKAVSFVGLILLVANFLTPAQSSPRIPTTPMSQGLLIAPEPGKSDEDLLRLTSHRCMRDCNRQCNRRCHHRCNRYKSRYHNRQCHRESNRSCDYRCGTDCYAY